MYRQLRYVFHHIGAGTNVAERSAVLRSADAFQVRGLPMLKLVKPISDKSFFE